MKNTTTFSRRALLRGSAQAVALGAFSSAFGPLLAAPASRWFKIGACDWSLGKRCDPAAFDVAKKIGLDGVQIDMGTTADGMKLRKPEVQKTFLAAAKRTGMEIGSVAMCELNAVPLKTDARAATWLSDGIDVCKTLGVTIIMPAFFSRGELNMQKTHEIDQLVRALKQVAPKAEKQGVLIGLENTLSAEDNVRIIDRVGSPAVKVYYDVGNSTDRGRNVAKEIRALGKLICQFHAKDAGYMLGRGRIDFREVRKAIDDIGFNGWIQIEAATPHGLVPDYTADRKFLKDIFAVK